MDDTTGLESHRSDTRTVRSFARPSVAPMPESLPSGPKVIHAIMPADGEVVRPLSSAVQPVINFTGVRDAASRSQRESPFGCKCEGH